MTSQRATKPAKRTSSRKKGQLLIPLTTHGGPRRGAGRKPKGERAMVSRLARPEITRHTPVHITLRLLPLVGSLRNSRTYREVQAALFEARARFGVRLVVQSTQGNHLHLICEAPSRRALARAMQGLCIRLAKALNGLLGRRGQVFADRYHMRVLTKPLQVRRALAYVLCNQRRHAAQRGCVLPGSWVDPCSSAMEFDGWQSRPMGDRGELPTVVPAESWLLRVGWRRHGLMAPSEVPGTLRERRSLSRSARAN